MYENILSKFNAAGETPIGEGTFALIYKGFSDQLNIDVAVKIFKKEHHSDQNYLEKFINEAQKVAGINHPNIIRIYANQLDEFYYVMSLLDMTLSDRLQSRGGMLSEGKLIRLAIEIAQALSELSNQERFGKRNVIHRDLKPANIMFDFNDNAVLTDFGVSIYEDEVPDSVAGTAQYMAPEQFKYGQKLDSRSDLYSLGVILYEVSTGRLPFVGTDFDELKKKHQNKIPTDPREYFLGINDEIADVILKLLEKDPGKRFPSPHSLLKKLENIRENYKNKRKSEYLNYRQNGETQNAKVVCEDYLRDVDPADRYFSEEFSKIKFMELINATKQDLVSLNVEKAVQRLEKIEMSLETESEKEYRTLKESIQIVKNCYRELLANLGKADIASARINFREIDQIIKSYDKNRKFQKVEYFRRLLNTLEDAQELYKNGDYSSALAEYQKAEKMDQNNLEFIGKKVLGIHEKIAGFDDQIKTMKSLIEKHQSTHDLDELKSLLDEALSSRVPFDAANRNILDSIYRRLLVVDGIEYKKQKDYHNALRQFRMAQHYSDAKSIKINILLLEIFLFEEKGTYSSAIINCESLLKKLHEVDSAEPEPDEIGFLPEFNLKFLKEKLDSLKFQSNLINEFEYIDRRLKLNRKDEATSMLDTIAGKVDEKKEQDETIDLSRFDTRIIAYRKKIESKVFDKKKSKPASTIANTPPPEKVQKPAIKSGPATNKIVIFAGLAFVLFIVVAGFFYFIDTPKSPQKPAPVASAYVIKNIPDYTEFLIDGEPVQLAGAIYEDSLLEGEHKFEFKNAEFVDTSFSAVMYADSSYQFSLADWQRAQSKIELIFNEKPDDVFVNRRRITSSSNRYASAVSPGMATIVVEKQGFESCSEQLQVEKNQTVTRNISLTPLPTGELKIAVFPYATMRLDGKLLQQNTNRFNTTGVAAGPHILTLAHEYFGVWETEITVESGQNNEYSFNLEDELGQIFVTIKDENNDRTFADIFLNGTIVKSQESFAEIDKLPGTYEISVKKPGYQSRTGAQSVKVQKKKTSTITFNMIKE